jgi:hypothetical protein
MMRKMNKADLLKKVGSMQQVAHVRPIQFEEGRAKGISGYDIKNGDLRFQVLGDKCLDIADFSYKGVNLSFVAKQGLVGRMDYDTQGLEGVRSIMGGLLFTCGLENTCIPCEESGVLYPMHGRMRSAPAEQLSGSAYWEDDVFKLSVSGEMREAELFGKNLKLTRTIETNYGEKSLTLTDKIENENFSPEPMMIMYHFNIGYPLLDEGAKVIIPTKEVTPRDEAAKKNADLWNLAEAPKVDEPERVYLHDLACDSRGNTFTCLVNPDLKLGVKISYNKKHLPKFVQWKSLGAGDYAMGLEPTNSGVYGRVGEGENINKIEPFDSEINQFVISIIEGDEEIEKVVLEAEKLIDECKC